MSQEETYIPGVGNNAYSGQNGPYSRKQMSGNENVMNKISNETFVSSAQQINVASNQPQKVNKAPVVGFLYSISGGIGEYWTVHIGKNTIGRSSDCNIQLPEMTVSDHHANLNVKQMKSTGKLTASIQDVGSKTGIYLNDEELDYEIHSCKHMDILTIGENYKLLLVLIDAEAFGLSVAENFIPAEVKENETTDIPVVPTHNSNPYDHNRRRMMDLTVDANGMQSTPPGGTKFM